MGENTACDPKEAALKGFFLGPQAENGAWLSETIQKILSDWFDWRRSLYPEDGNAITDSDQATPEFRERRERFSRALEELARRYESEVPKFSPRYVGHMFSEVSLPGFLGHIATLLHNPNNISGESAPVGVQIEDEAVQDLLTMVGFSTRDGVGHFTSGGTVANFEAMVRARERCAKWIAAGALLNCSSRPQRHWALSSAAGMGWDRYDQIADGKSLNEWTWTEGNPYESAKRISSAYGSEFFGPVLLIPENKHYSWKKGVSLFGLGEEAYWPIRLSREGRLDVDHLSERLEEARTQNRPVMMVVSVLGSTEMGSVDPVDRIQDLLDDWKRKTGIEIWHHVDAAYGGFFRTLGIDASEVLSSGTASALNALGRVQSVTLDPHKLGYVPYSSGTFLTSDRRNYYVKTYDSPYIDFQASRDRGPFTIEGSRSATGATATWMTARCIGLDHHGYGKILSRTIRIRKKLQESIRKSGLPIRMVPHLDTNILCFTVALEGEKLSLSNQRVLKVFEEFSNQKSGKFFVSKTSLSRGCYGQLMDEFIQTWNGILDVPELRLIRMVIMNPFFDSKEMKTDFSREWMAELESMIGGMT